MPTTARRTCFTDNYNPDASAQGSHYTIDAMSRGCPENALVQSCDSPRDIASRVSRRPSYQILERNRPG